MKVLRRIVGWAIGGAVLVLVAMALGLIALYGLVTGKEMWETTT